MKIFQKWMPVFAPTKMYDANLNFVDFRRNPQKLISHKIFLPYDSYIANLVCENNVNAYM